MRAARRLHHQVRPQVGFHEQREIGPPMVEEAPHVARHVDRHELVDDAARQPLLRRAPLEVTVPVVTSTQTSRAAMRSISGSTLASSPTLAACSQTSAPGGRAPARAPAPFQQTRDRLLAAPLPRLAASSAPTAAPPPTAADRRTRLPAAGRSRRGVLLAVGDGIGARGHAVELILDLLPQPLPARRRRRRAARRSARPPPCPCG